MGIGRVPLSAFALATLLLVVVPGCLKAQESTTLKKDGSGTYVQVLTIDMAKAKEYQAMLLAKASSLGIPGDEGEPDPLADLAVKKRSEELSGRKGIRVRDTRESEDKKTKARTHALTVDFDNLRALFEAGVIEDMTCRLEQAKDKKTWTLELRHEFDASEEADAQPGRRKKLLEMRRAMLARVERWWGSIEIESKLTLPAPIVKSNGSIDKSKRTVTWRARFKDLHDPANLTQTVTFEHVEGLTLKPFALTANDIANAREEAQLERERAAAEKKPGGK